MRKENKLAINVILAVWCGVFFTLFVFSWFGFGKTLISHAAPVDTETTVTESNTETTVGINPNETVYMICDVTDYTETEVFVEVANGDIVSLDMPEDAPDEMREVVICTTNLDDYETYEIKGMR